jgi:Holliday junction resolvase RusA-like endonuclease
VELLLVVNGEPVPRSEGVWRDQIYDRRKVVKRRVKAQILAQAPRSSALLDCALRVQICYFLRIPASVPKSLRLKMLSGEVRPTKKPDLTNLTKLIEDCCTGLIWRDDSLIVSESTDKFWGEKPRTVIRIEPWTAGATDLIA